MDLSRASCKGKDPNMFFPKRGDNIGNAQAKAVCKGCVIRWQCLDWAMKHPECDFDGIIATPIGIVGGMSGKQRRKLRGDTAELLKISIKAKQERCELNGWSST